MKLIRRATTLELQKELAHKAVSENPLLSIKKGSNMSLILNIKRLGFRKIFKGTINFASDKEMEEFQQKEAEFLKQKKVKTEKTAIEEEKQEIRTELRDSSMLEKATVTNQSSNKISIELDYKPVILTDFQPNKDVQGGQ